MTYEGPIQLSEDSGWYFKRQISDDVAWQWFGPYPTKLNCQENLERTRKYDNLTGSGGGLQQFVNAPSSWREICRDLFGTNSIEAFPPRGSRG